MGRFEKFVYSEGAWSDSASGTAWLSLDIYDSDLATVQFEPSPSGQGLFYLGFQPRDYFEDPSVSGDVNVAVEAGALSQWAQVALARAVNPLDVVPLLAVDGIDEPQHVFVEETVIQLLNILELPIPPDLGEPQ